MGFAERKLAGAARSGKESTFMRRNLHQYSRKDLERFVTVSTQELTRAELRVRKLLLKYHDRKTTSVGRRNRGVEARARRVAERTPEENEWMMYDRVMHPDAHPDRAEEEEQEAAVREA